MLAASNTRDVPHQVSSRALRGSDFGSMPLVYTPDISLSQGFPT